MPESSTRSMAVLFSSETFPRWMAFQPVLRFQTVTFSVSPETVTSVYSASKVPLFCTPLSPRST